MLKKPAPQDVTAEFTVKKKGEEVVKKEFPASMAINKKLESDSESESTSNEYSYWDDNGVETIHMGF